MGSPLCSAFLGASTFCAKHYGADECDSKGLPLTPHSINIVGRFQRLQELEHPGLCAYLDIKRASNERLIVVSEWYEDCVENHVKSDTFSNVKSLRRLAWQVLDALAYLNQHAIVHRFLAPDTILLTPQGDVKLHNHGLYYMTDCGKAVKFPIGSPRYLAPETIMTGPCSTTTSSPKVDVWSLGMILLELFLGTPIYPDLFLKNALTALFKRLMLLTQNFQREGVHPVKTLLEAHRVSDEDKPMASDLRSFLEACLTPIPSKRPSPLELLSHPFLADMANEKTRKNGLSFSFLPSPLKQLYRCRDLDFDLPSHTHTHTHTPHTFTDDHLAERSVREVYYLWSLAGGEVETELRKRGLIQSRPPICRLPCLVTNEREEHGVGRNRVSLYDNTVLSLSLDQLRQRLEGMTTADYYPLIDSGPSGEGEMAQERHESSLLPVPIKEKDVEYQFHRMVLFTRLLESYPHSRPRLVMEAVVDVCPVVRAEVWAALLGVKGDIQARYAAIDKDTEASIDRQIDVDIPRCHQYSTLMASQEGHRKFKRILKAWVLSNHRNLVYWQGLDSLCAPFLALNFNDEALAFACLSTFISKYLHKFFLKDNSAIMQEYLAVFSHMIAFHEPKLYNHLDSIAFHPELYAIPWFLTMFTHILPLHKIYYLWDTLLLGNCSFPLFFGVSILQHLRDDLLIFDFNECIMMFSDMPDIDIQACIHDAVKVYLATPSSVYLRKYDHTYSPPTNIPPEALREPLPLSALRQESCPHISAHDVISLCQLEYQALGYGGGARDHDSTVNPANPLLRRAEAEKKGREGRGGKAGRKGRKGVLVDIRSQEEFRLGHVPGSLNLPHQHGFQPDGSLTPSPSSSSLTSARGRSVVVVVANKGESGPVFARQLVRLKFSHVCVLHNGVGVLRSLGLLTSLGDDP